jgi:hypothetical protein
MANLVRFDWAVKKLLRDKANFDVLEGFLSELFNYRINREVTKSKKNKNQTIYSQ